MRKIIVLAAMLAMMLVAAAPAFAHTVAIDEGDDTQFNIVASQAQFAFANQENTGDATADASGDSAAAASVSQDLSISQDQSLMAAGVSGSGDVFVDLGFFW